MPLKQSRRALTAPQSIAGQGPMFEFQHSLPWVPLLSAFIFPAMTQECRLARGREGFLCEFQS